MHDFWLFQESKRRYQDVADLWSRSADAPLRMDDGVLRYVSDTLAWVPTVIPSTPHQRHLGLNWFGETVINRSGATLFADICAGWARLFACGPLRFTLRGDFSWNTQGEEPPRNWDSLANLGEYDTVSVERDRVVHVLEALADYGRQAATGDYFIVHIGI